MDSVTLPPDLEQFATEAVAAGRYSDTAEVVRAGVDLLKRQEQARADFVASLDAAVAVLAARVDQRTIAQPLQHVDRGGRAVARVNMLGPHALPGGRP